MEYKIIPSLLTVSKNGDGFMLRSSATTYLIFYLKLLVVYNFTEDMLKFATIAIFKS